MKSILKALSSVVVASAVVTTVAVAQTPTPAPADSKQVTDMKKQLQDQGITVNYVETAQKGITLSGYVDVSYTDQFASGGVYQPGNPDAKANLRQFDKSNNDFNVQAVKIALQKSLPDKNEWAAGFRIDTIYGSDAKYLSDTAFPSTDLALEQAYVNFRVPIGNGLDFKFGKFVTLLGYEVIESPSNPNFSRGLLFTNAIPLTHTGILAAYKFNDTVDVQGGIVDGWNNSQSASVKENGAAGAFGAAAYTPVGSGGASETGSFGKAITGQIHVGDNGKNADLYNSFIYSPEGEPGVVGVDNGPVVVYDIYGNWKPLFLKDQNWTLGFNVDLGYNGASGVPLAPAAAGVATVPNSAYHDTNTWYGVALYSLYQFKSDNWKWLSVAGRAEYLHCDSAFVPKYGAGTGPYGLNVVGGKVVPYGAQDDYSYTATANFAIWDNLLTRVEYRFDDLHGGATTLGNGHADLQHEISINAVYSF